MADDFEALKRYIGNSTTERDVATASQAGRLATTLGVANRAPEIGDALPQAWYGIFFPSLAPTASLRADGQPGEGLMPPVPLPRRRLDGVRATFHEPIRIGDALTGVSEVTEVSVDDTGAGPVVGVTIAETITAGGKLAVVEQRSFRFFGETGPGIADEDPALPAAAAWSRRIEPGPVLLFRLSAVRFNSHRLHYDRDYATKVEGLPGLAVPITLVSAQMMEMLAEELPGRKLAVLDYRAVRRIFDIGAYDIHGAPEGDPEGNKMRLWATDHDGALCVLAEATLIE